MVVSSDGQVLFASAQLCKAIGSAASNVVGRSLFDLSLTRPDKLSQYLENCVRSRQMVMGALEIPSEGDEGSLLFRCEGAVIPPAVNNDPTAQPAMIFLRLRAKEKADQQFSLLTRKIDELNREIFDRRNAEEESRRLYLEVAEASRLKDEFLATVSHELRTPLNVILGWSRMLRTSQPEPEKLEKALATIERTARSQNQLIEDLLDVSRIVTGKLRLDVRPVEISTVVASAVDSLRPAAENKNVRLQTVIDPLAGMVSGDAERLQQAIWNLLANAIKFTPKGGRVQVRLERVNSHVEVIVSDTGIGIDPDFIPFVFDRFRQADGSKTRHYGGLGLGLSIVRHLVELHGGTAHVASEGPGKGAVFTIMLPSIIASEPFINLTSDGDRRHPRAEQESSRLEAPGGKTALTGVNILVVDDEGDAREMMREMLELYGATVRTAASAAEAVAKMAGNDHDLLISDIEMPEEDGYSLIRKIRAGAAEIPSTNIAAIALTAHARVTDRLSAIEAGFDTHVAKPFELVELVAVIVGLLRRTRT
ncbi:MAG: hybrid sensor histidine kinase/response regulator [Blastocatellia bacterium]|nr:hybrid sensor histidine kinase/response regulator [Blastocatellia bacterium]